MQKIEQEYEKEWCDEDFYNNTQGHDFFMLYAAICNQFKSKGVKYTELEASSRCIFREKDFEQTNLYNKLSQYENLHQLKICAKKNWGDDHIGARPQCGQLSVHILFKKVYLHF